MARFRVPTAELQVIVDPIAADKWGAGEITLQECVAAVESAGIEERPWQIVKDTISSAKENRDYHLRRIGTLMGFAFASPDPEPEADINLRVHLALAFGDDGTKKAWLIDGNHRVAAAYFMDVEHIDLDITSSDADRITEVLPGAVMIEVPQQNVQENAPPAAEQGGD